MKWYLKWFWSGAKKPTQAIQEEIEAESGRIERLTAQLADIEQKLRHAREEEQRAEQWFVRVQEAVVAARTQVSDKNVSAIEVCAGEVRWHNGLLEQLWHIYYFGPTGAVEKTEEEWQLVPELEKPAIAGHIRPCRKAA